MNKEWVGEIYDARNPENTIPLHNLSFSQLLGKVRNAYQEDTLQELKQELEYEEGKNQESILLVGSEHLKHQEYAIRILSIVGTAYCIYQLFFVPPPPFPEPPLSEEIITRMWL